MYNNIGKKIKTVAKAAGYVGTIVSMIVGYITLPYGGFLIFIFGPIVSWLSTFLIYGFGQLIENTDVLAAQVRNQNFENDEKNDTSARYCQKCGKVVTSDICPYCGTIELMPTSQNDEKD